MFDILSDLPSQVEVMTFVKEALLANEFFTGAGLVALITGSFVYFRAIPGRIYGFVKSLFLVQVDVPDRSIAFRWLETWMILHPRINRTRNLTVSSSEYDNAFASTSKMFEKNSVSKPAAILSIFSKKWYRFLLFLGLKGDSRVKSAHFSLAPAPGSHLLTFKGRPIFVGRTRRELEHSSAFRENLSITIPGRDPQLAKDILEEARKVYNAVNASDKEESTRIWRAKGGSWATCKRKPKRAVSSIILSENIRDDLFKDLQTFQDSKDWYRSLGIPYHRGYLLYGPPGNGKSSLVHAAASHMSKDLHVIHLSDLLLNDPELSDLFSEAGDGVVLLEDIDTVFSGRDRGSDNESGVTFRGLLNILDGVDSGEGVIVFMTTNHPERLDPALVRPGRADMRLEIADPTKKEIELMFKRFFPDSDSMAAEFASLFPEGKRINMATVQNYLMDFRDDPAGACEHISVLIKRKNDIVPHFIPPGTGSNGTPIEDITMTPRPVSRARKRKSSIRKRKRKEMVDDGRIGHADHPV